MSLKHKIESNSALVAYYLRRHLTLSCGAAHSMSLSKYFLNGIHVIYEMHGTLDMWQRRLISSASSVFKMWNNFAYTHAWVQAHAKIRTFDLVHGFRVIIHSHQSKTDFANNLIFMGSRMRYNDILLSICSLRNALQARR